MAVLSYCNPMNSLLTKKKKKDITEFTSKLFFIEESVSRLSFITHITNFCRDQRDKISKRILQGANIVISQLKRRHFLVL